MDEESLSRRRFLAGAGSTLSVAIAGCTLDAPQQETSTQTPAASSPETTPTPGEFESGEFPEEFEQPDGEFEQPQADSDLSRMYQEIVDSVAAVRIEAAERASGGTAWVYDEDYLVTNDHVVADVPDPFVWFTGVGWREARIVGTDVHSDLAVIEVADKPDDATPLELIESPRPVGTEVAAVGNPFGLTGSFTTGVISGRNRTVPVPGRPFSIADGIQTDAALNPGNSGGPLVTMDGEVVGVVSAGQGDNTGFAISAAMVRQVVPALVERGSYEHSFLGIVLQDVTPAHIEANDLPVSWGVYVNETIAGEAADGVLRGSETTVVVRGREVPVGGDVIVRMGEWAIPTTERLSAFLALETRPGDTIEIEIVRDGRREVVEVTLGARPEPDS